MLRYWMYIGILLCGLSSHAQSYQINVRKLGTGQGLSHQTVLSLLQDREGYLWVGTKYGLNRFDGHRFTWYTQQTHGLQAKQVSNIFQASDHRLWLLERQENLHDTLFSSLELFDPYLQQSTSLSELLKQPLPFPLESLKWVDALADGTLLLNTRENTFALHDKQGIRKTAIPKGFRLVKALGKNDIWGMLGTQLLRLNMAGEMLSQFPFKPTQMLFQVKKEKTGRYWAVIGDRAKGSKPSEPGEIWLIEKGQKKRPPIDLTFGLPYEFHVEVFKDQPAVYFMYRDRCWSWHDSLQLLSPIPTFVSERGKKMDDVFYRDKQGILWYGHRDGLWAIQRTQNPFRQWMKGEKNDMFPVRGIGQQGNRLYINSMKGCVSIDLETGEKRSLIESYPELSSFKPFPMFQTLSGELWTSNNALFQLDSLGFISRQIDLPPKAGRTWTFFQDKEETWWIGAGEGELYYFNENIHKSPRLFQQHNGFDAFSNARKWHFADGPYGIWIASQDGLFLLEKGKGITARYAENEAGRYYLPSRVFHHIYCDSAGIMWIATGDAGLIRVGADSLVHGDEQPDYFQLTRSQGLPSNELYASLEDHADHLWISTANGLVQLSKETLEINTYFEEQGITHNEFNRISYYKSPMGRMYFGGLNGVNSFDPRDFYDKIPYQPPLLIADVALFSGKENRLIKLNDKLKQENAIDYDPGDKYLKLQFSLQDYFYSDQIRYSYQIKGYQEEWLPTNGNELQLSGLPYGTFRLRVRGQGPDKRFSEKEALLNIRVHRPFYLKSWFLILMLIALGFTLWQVYYWRVQSLQKRQLLLERMVQERTQKIMQDKLTIEQQAAELQELNEMKSRFFANVSHELRTPLTLVLGPLARVLRRNRLESTDQNALRMMQTNGKQLLRRINELLDLSRLEAGKMTLNQRVLPLQPFLQQCLASFRDAARLNDIDLSLQAHLEQDLQILTDKDKLEKILSNFLSNAIKFTPQGGKVSLRVFSSESGAAHAPALRFAVTDTGPGLSPEDLERVFDRFYQSNSSDQASGTGIGLSLARELADIMEGKVWAESEKGKGATFCLQIPLKAAQRQVRIAREKEVEKTVGEPKPQPLSQGASQKATILLAEDHPDMRRYICEVLSDYQVITAAHGAEALQLLQDPKLQTPNPKLQTRNSKLPTP
jgi:signal transduction histidine kinase